MQAIKSSQPAAQQARDLISAAAFAAVTATVQENNTDMDLAVAERVTEEALKFVATSGRFPGHSLRPSRIVDEGWHALILYTRVYAKLCANLAGFVHHTPDRPASTAVCTAALDRTQDLMTQAGYQPDLTLWLQPSGAANCTPECTTGPPQCCGTCEPSKG
ncbi:glycine-rich domain-containing protein [Streptomyces sp. NPDC052236]|uniref:glycine-rich domain-containing protein n=1 Tax=Streptomyces sp. NPDC052236 TaxID=3365686 RepID=UPI0037D0FC52